MNPLNYLKAIIAALLAGLAVLTQASANKGAIHAGDYVMALTAALTVGVSTYAAGNKTSSSVSSKPSATIEQASANLSSDDPPLEFPNNTVVASTSGQLELPSHVEANLTTSGPQHAAE